MEYPPLERLEEEYPPLEREDELLLLTVDELLPEELERETACLEELPEDWR